MTNLFFSSLVSYQEISYLEIFWNKENKERISGYITPLSKSRARSKKVQITELVFVPS